MFDCFNDFLIFLNFELKRRRHFFIFYFLFVIFESCEVATIICLRGILIFENSDALIFENILKFHFIFLDKSNSI